MERGGSGPGKFDDVSKDLLFAKARANRALLEERESDLDAAPKLKVLMQLNVEMV